MYHLVAILDTRSVGPHGGIAHACAVCGKRHYIWACFRQTRAVSGLAGGVRLEDTGKVLVTGVACGRKVLVPCWESTQTEEMLEHAGAHALRPESSQYPTYLQEFQ